MPLFETSRKTSYEWLALQSRQPSSASTFRIAAKRILAREGDLHTLASVSRPDFHDLLRVTAFWTLTFGSAIVQAEEPVQMEASPPSEALSLVPGPLLSPEPNPTPLPDRTMPQPLPVMPTPVLPESKALSEES